MTLNVATGDLTGSPDGLQPYSPGLSPGVAPVTPVSGQLTAADQTPARDLTGERLSQLAGDEAAIAGAQQYGMDARNAMLDHYAQDINPVGCSYGDPVNLPPVPAAAVPPAMSDEYPFPGMEPTEAEAGMAGPYPTGP